MASGAAAAMLEQFNATIDKLYGAAAGACAWPDALVAVENLTGSAGAVIDLVPKSAAATGKTLAGSFSEENCAEYCANYQSICPRIRFAMANPLAGTQSDYLFMTEATMDRDPVYEWFGKHALRYYIGSQVAHTPNYFAFLSLQRTRRQGHAQSEDVALFEMLKPHLVRAASLADQLGTLRAQQRFTSSMLEALPQAVFALDRAARVLFANTAASRLLLSSDGIRVEAGRLMTAALAEQVSLDAMIQGALKPLSDVQSGWTRASRLSGGLPYAVFIAPLTGAGDELTAANAKVLVMVYDTAENRSADTQMLTDVYGLTDAEARLAGALSCGHSIQSAAALLGVRPATARSQLKAVFRKMRVSRQQDLVRLLASLSSLARSNHDR
jgi:DNA-binding CsgD family transcriptional regulator